MKVSIIVVAHNEEKNIKHCLQLLLNHFSKKNYEYEIIVSEDGSTDRTYEIAKKFEKRYNNIKVLHTKKKLGKGGGIIKGFKNANGDIVIFTDTDLAALPSQMDKLIDEINRGEDVAISSKYIKGSKILKKPPTKKMIAGKIFNLFLNLLFNFNIKDTQCGLKAIKGSALKKIINKLTKTGWDFDVEFLLRAKQNNLKIKEVPVVWSHKEETTKFYFIKDSTKMGFGILNLWFREYVRKFDILFIILFLSFFLGCLSLFGSAPIADEGTHNLLGLFFYDFMNVWIKNPFFSIKKIYDYFINYLVYYPKLSLYYPPLPHILLSFMYRIFGLSFFTGSLTILFFSLGTLFLIFFFAKKHLKNSEISLFSSLFYVLTPIVIFLSTKTLTDIPILFFFLVTLYSYVNALSSNKMKWFIISSILLSLGFLIKWNIILLVPIILIYSILEYKKSLKKLISSIIITLILLSPYLYLAFKFDIPSLVIKTSTTEAGYLEKDPQWTSLEGWFYYPKQFSITYLSYPLFIFSLITLIIYCKKKNKHWKLFLIWFVIGYLFYTWLPNKDPRYIITIFPSLIFPFASFISSMTKRIKIISVMSICVILLISSYFYLVPVFQHNIDYNLVIDEIGKEEGNILLASENSWFYSSSFMFSLASKEGRFVRKIYRPCTIDKFDLEELLNNEGIKYVIIAEPVREIHEKNIEKVNGTSTLNHLTDIEGKNMKVIIYRNSNYHKSESTCNYVCVLNDWMCSNSTMKFNLW